MEKIVDLKLALAIFFVIIALTSVLADSDIIDLVHKDYDFFIRISNGGGWYEELKKVPFFAFVLNRKGLGFEESFLRILEDMRYRTGVLPTVIQDAISTDILFASKGIQIDLSNVVSFDINYYFDFVKTIAANSFFAFQTKSPSQFVKGIAYLLSVNYKPLPNNQYLLGDTLYCGYTGKYFVIAGSKTALELALKTYATPDMQLSRTSKVFERLRAGTFFISGYSKPETLRFNLPGASIDSSESEYVLFYSTVSAGNFSITFEQKNKKQLTTKRISENIGNIPMAWNYYLSVPSSDTEGVVEILKQWLQGSNADLARVLEFVSALSKSSSNVYVVGRLETGDFLFIFDNSSTKALETSVAKLGAKYDTQKQEWNITFQSSKLYTFYIANRVFFGSIDRAKYEQYEKTRGRLKELPMYYDFSKLTTYDFKLLLDIGDIIKSTTGFNVSSKMLFWKYTTGYFSYYKIIIS